MKAASASLNQPRPKAGVNQPVTWGELFLILDKRPQDLRRAIFEKIMEIDSRANQPVL